MALVLDAYEEAMKAHTIGAACAAYEEKIKGSIEPGKMADLAVWTKEPYIQPQQQLYKATIDLTMVGGKVVYQRALMSMINEQCDLLILEKG